MKSADRFAMSAGVSCSSEALSRKRTAFGVGDLGVREAFARVAARKSGVRDGSFGFVKVDDVVDFEELLNWLSSSWCCDCRRVI